jgi:4-hydroxybenzoate polyprenyltransferase
MTAAYAYINALLIATVVATVLFLYDRNLKATPLWGNATVAAVCATTVIFGSLHGNGWNRQLLVLTVSAFCLTLVRELYKDVEDVEGDKAMGARTFPILYGGFRSALVALIPLAFAFSFVLYRILSSVPNWGGAYVMGVLLLAGLSWTGLSSLRTRTAHGWGRRSLEMKVWIMLGVIWVLLWRIPLGS